VRVDWLREAALNVDEITAYIAAENPAAARKIGQRIGEAAERLAELPIWGVPVESQGRVSWW